MDEPTDRATLKGCLRNLRVANRLTGAYRPTLGFLDRVLRHHQLSAPLRILDVGSGYGDMLRRIALWARERSIAVELTGIDLNPLATSIAAEASAEEGFASDAITWRTADATAVAERAPDVVLSSLVMHHLEDDEIVRMLAWMDTTARLGWFINDLERRSSPVLVWRVAASVLGWHPFLKSDGPTSFRRAFRRDDWERLLAAAQVPFNAAVVHHVFPARLCVTRMR